MSDRECRWRNFVTGNQGAWLGPLEEAAFVMRGMIRGELMFHKLVATVAWVLFGLIILVTICPLQDRPVVGFARFEHYAAFAVLGALFSLTYPRQIILVSLLLAGAAAGLELTQYLTPDRHPRLSDVYDKALGGMAGIILTHLILRLVSFTRGNSSAT